MGTAPFRNSPDPLRIPVLNPSARASSARGRSGLSFSSFDEPASPRPVLSIVSPVHCEAPGLAAFLDALDAVALSLGLPYEIVLVDDGSTDDTWQCMGLEAARRPHLRCLRLSRNFGKEAALVAGIEAARGDAVITLDSDLQHPPRLIPEMVALWREGKADLIEARKEYRQRESALSRLFAGLFYALFARIAPFDLKGAGDFKLMDRKVVEAWKQLRERRVFFRGMSSWLGFRTATIYFSPADRESGLTKWSFGAKLMLALDSLSAYSTKPLSLIWGLGVFFALFAVLVGGEALWMKFQGEAMSGFTTVILLILITGCALLMSICLLSLYVRQIFHEVKGRPRYLVTEHIGVAPAACPPLPRTSADTEAKGKSDPSTRRPPVRFVARRSLRKKTLRPGIYQAGQTGPRPAPRAQGDRALEPASGNIPGRK